MADWDESEHPRDQVGRFRDKAGGWVTAVSDRIRGGSRYKRVEGQDRSDEVIERAGHYATIYMNPNEFGDEIVDDIAALQGFDGLPAVGTETELDQAVSEGGAELWRGVQGWLPVRIGYGDQEGEVVYQRGGGAPTHLEQWREGAYHAGNGIYGQGIYTSIDRRVAQFWASQMKDAYGEQLVVWEPFPGGEPGHMIGRPVADPRAYTRMVLASDARVVEFDDPVLDAYIDKLRANIGSKDLVEAVQRREAEIAGFDSPEEIADLRDDNEWRQFARSMREDVIALLSDRGRAAIALGYDAIWVPTGGLTGRTDGAGIDADQYVILNRTALLVQEAYDENLLPPEVIRTWETRRD